MTRSKATAFIGVIARMAAGMEFALQAMAGRVRIPPGPPPRRARYRRSARVVLAAILALIVAVPVSGAGPNVASPAPQPSPAPLGPSSLATSGPKVLIYGPTSGGYADSTPGINVTVWDEATWASKSTADFAAFDRLTPVQVSGLTGVTPVAGGTAHSLVLKSNGTV